jgi:hypothetical protein
MVTSPQRGLLTLINYTFGITNGITINKASYLVFRSIQKIRFKGVVRNKAGKSMVTKEKAREQVEEFLQLYKKHLAEGKFEGQKEANTEHYIEHLFEILGWDRLR